ncbi:hypothetical protein D3C86_2176870 [compost metagenome]
MLTARIPDAPAPRLMPELKPLMVALLFVTLPLFMKLRPLVAVERIADPKPSPGPAFVIEPRLVTSVALAI